jgi:hypothetical protein
VKTGLVQGIHNVFIMSTIVMFIGLIALFFLKEIPLRGGRSRSSARETLTETLPVGAGN